jgi:dienelactone hydrolase
VVIDRVAFRTGADASVSSTGCDVSDPEAVIALSSAITALNAVPQADPSRLAIMRICQTGRLLLVVAASRPVSAALVWYGAAQPREW